MPETITTELALASYLDGPTRLNAAVADLSRTELDHAPATGGWTIRQLVHHIVDGDDLWKMAIKAALGNGDGVFELKWYWDKSQDEWADSWHYADRPIGPSLTLFTANRRHIAQLLEKYPETWMRSIQLQWPGKPEVTITIADVIASQARHTNGHIEDILAIRREHGL